MEELSIKPENNLIIISVEDKYYMNWCGKIKDAKPKIKNNLPVFTIVGVKGRIEVNTVDMNYIERCAKALTQPKGRQSIATDNSYIYIQQEDDSEKLLGIMTHDYIKHYAPIMDKISYRY